MNKKTFAIIIVFTLLAGVFLIIADTMTFSAEISGPISGGIILLGIIIAFLANRQKKAEKKAESEKDKSPATATNKKTVVAEKLTDAILSLFITILVIGALGWCVYNFILEPFINKVYEVTDTKSAFIKSIPETRVINPLPIGHDYDEKQKTITAKAVPVQEQAKEKAVPKEDKAKPSKATFFSRWKKLLSPGEIYNVFPVKKGDIIVWQEFPSHFSHRIFVSGEERDFVLVPSEHLAWEYQVEEAGMLQIKSESLGSATVLKK